MAKLIEEGELIRLVEGLSRAELNVCLAAGWVIPAESGNGRHYQEIDLARLRLIHELRADLGLDDEAVPVVLSLIDQLHTMRHALRCMAEALRAEPEDTRRRMLADIAARMAGP